MANSVFSPPKTEPDILWRSQTFCGFLRNTLRPLYDLFFLQTSISMQIFRRFDRFALHNHNSDICRPAQKSQQCLLPESV
mgnify:FL=1